MSGRCEATADLRCRCLLGGDILGRSRSKLSMAGCAKVTGMCRPHSLLWHTRHFGPVRSISVEYITSGKSHSPPSPRAGQAARRNPRFRPGGKCGGRAENHGVSGVWPSGHIVRWGVTLIARLELPCADPVAWRCRVAYRANAVTRWEPRSVLWVSHRAPDWGFSVSSDAVEPLARQRQRSRPSPF